MLVIAVHGGAGHHSAESKDPVMNALRRACQEATGSVTSTSTATDGVERAIKVLEADENLNAGFGSNLTYEGSVECDSSIMDGSEDFGAVGAVSGIKHPISVARALLQQSKTPLSLGRVHPLLLVSDGAYAFAQRHLPTDQAVLAPPASLISPKARAEWSHWRKVLDSADTEQGAFEVPSSAMQDTVGAVAFDSVSGSAAAGVSSGGILLKMEGRVGEAAVFGAGCWSSPTVAVSVTGTGEQIVRCGLARRLAEAVEACYQGRGDVDVHSEIERVMETEFIKSCRARGSRADDVNAGALILVNEIAEGTPDSKVRLYCAFTTESMAIGYATSTHRKPKAKILRQSVDASKSTVCIVAISL